MTDLIRTTRGRLDQVLQEMRWIETEGALFRVEGTGAADCLQGLLTCDIIGPGTDAVSYGAMLTPKGMIAVDFLILRDSAGFTLVADPGARLAALDLFRKQLPPRLARVTDRTDTSLVLWLVGMESETVARAAGFPWPEHPARLAGVPTDHGPVLLGRLPPAAPWAAVMVGPTKAVQAAGDRLTRGGGRPGSADDLEAIRILHGWPLLNREIDQKTLPQEVRYDELGGVSYTKGCYIGQETVARVHFRGHVNRVLRGLRWEGAVPSEREIRVDETKVVGRLTSAMQLEDGGLGLCVIRREVTPGSLVRIGATDALVVELPFQAQNAEAPGTGPGASPRQ